jgi:hypothetical protein
LAITMRFTSEATQLYKSACALNTADTRFDHTATTPQTGQSPHALRFAFFIHLHKE